jgi:hypothetical protein
VPDGFHGPLVGLADQGLELGEDLFDGAPSSLRRGGWQPVAVELEQGLRRRNLGQDQHDTHARSGATRPPADESEVLKMRSATVVNLSEVLRPYPP